MRIPRRKRKVTTITLDPEIVEKAREHGLNISKLSEDALKETIEKLEAKPVRKLLYKLTAAVNLRRLRGKSGGDEENRSR